MNRGLEGLETAPIRAHAVGSSTWLRTVRTGLDDGDVAVHGPFEPSELDAAPLEGANCVLTDDRDVLAALGDEWPVVYAVESPDTGAIDRLLSDGAADVIAKTTTDQPSLLAHRLRRAVESASARRTAARRAEWFESLLAHTDDLLILLDTDGSITYVGPSAEQVGGYDAERMLDTHFLEYVHPDDASALRADFDALCAADPGATTTAEYRCQHADRSWYEHEVVLTNRLGDETRRSPSRRSDSDGEIDGIVASIRDVSEIHRVERDLAESFDRVSDAVFALDPEWRFTSVNDRAATILDVDPAEAKGRKILELFPELRDTPFQEAALEATRTGDSTSLERYYEPSDRWYDVQLYPSSSGLSVYLQDVTDRVERKRDLKDRTERLETLVQNVPVVLFAFDDEGTITLAEGRALENLDAAADDVVGQSVFDVFEDYEGVLADFGAALEGESTHSSATLDGRVFEAWCRPITEDGTVERVIGTAVDVTERAQYQEALNALHEATSHLLTVESEQAACEYVVDVACDVLDLETVVYRFDDQRNELVPTAYSQGLEEAIGSPPRLQPGDGPAWTAFVEDTPGRFDDLADSSLTGEPPGNARSGLYVPIGEHGVLVALDPQPARYDDETFELAKLFARTAEAALDRITRTRRLHGHEWELKRQNRHLERLNAASQVRQDIEQLLLMADSRAEIERGICDRLADLESCSFAWIGEPDPGGTRIRPRVRAGHERGYLDAVAVTTVDDSAAEPTGRAARTRSPMAVENVADSVRDGSWRGDALSRSFQSVYAVPLVYDGFLYGVLALYCDDRDAFDEPLRSMLAELGETIGYAIDTVKRTAALRDDDVAVVELELDLEDAVPMGRLADRLGSRVEFEGRTTRAEDSPTIFAVVDGAVDPETTDPSDIEGIGDVAVIAETDAETLVQLRYTTPFLGAAVDAHGGTLRTLVADDDGVRATVVVPESIEIRDVLSELRRRGFAASLVARREDSTTARAAIDASARNSLLDRLTDRQREVVQTAYHGGFFEWPRRTTGEAIADSLDISAPAFHKHVRAVELKLFTALFDDSSSVGLHS
ncbi:PAS domain-containing protein [Haloterrigena alkaliphila]|uniref:PAS domain S-box protein n=1 Tax=Haloterrigena alkaliphila TaxID=2816475 RepID=A0A8A2VEI9_9EURY|nr:PAS domain-containing protein [Haloterrigena alkaliphila]QSW99097.1 PAS domain S-box protein [Haloterrigena alkaliphila]